MRRLIGGRPTAFTHVVERHQGSLIRLAMAFVASRKVAEEVVRRLTLALALGPTSAAGGPFLIPKWIERNLVSVQGSL
jgi:hypothetical protein